jgi:uncharacterized protein YaaN involved in tellurite resistance
MSDPTPAAPAAPAAAAGAEGQLAPPHAAATLVLAPPEAVAAVEPDKAGGMVPLDKAALPALDTKVTEFVDSLTTLDPHSPEFGAKAEEIRTMGDADIRAAADVSNRMLQSPLRAMKKSGVDKDSTVSTSLVELRRTVEDLDPAHGLKAHGILSHIPFIGDKLRDYFAQYESAQTHINAIIHALYDGQDELRKDNAALEQEKAHLWETMQHLTQYIYLSEHLDSSLTAKIAAMDATDAEKAKALREDLLFYVRQKHQDLLTQLAVAIQGYLATDLIRKNNNELIKGVDRATTTTVSALRTAVIVAQALANQKLVLDQITALNTTTSNMIESTSQMLATQSAEINQQAASSTIGIEKLQAAFSNIYQTMDAIDTFKVQALDAMQQTISTLDTEVAKAQTYLARSRSAEGKGDGDAGQSGLTIPGDK